ncbi:MAG: MBL fold metallo-hydrolase [Actinomycetota bacterium]|nr:MBL fold metallo-hydrolase [Actinomycetota bacterium]
MRVLALNEDVLVAVSSIWQTSCTAVRSGEEGFVIDSPVYPVELEALPGLLEQAGFPVSGLLATHGDWDHLLGRLAFPELALGCGESTADRLGADPGHPVRELRKFDEEHYVDARPPLLLAGIQSLPVPGRLSLGPERELELHPTGGHTGDGTAFLIEWARVLVCGDYLSPVEIPAINEGGSRDAYLATLDRLAPLIERVDTVVPGHGAPIARERALQVWREDVEYLRALAHEGAGAQLPASRRNRTQGLAHAENVKQTDH